MQEAFWQPLNLTQEALPKEQNNTHSRARGCSGREGFQVGRGCLPGTSAVLSHPPTTDLTGQIAQGPLRSLAVPKLSSHF